MFFPISCECFSRSLESLKRKKNKNKKLARVRKQRRVATKIMRWQQKRTRRKINERKLLPPCKFPAKLAPRRGTLSGDRNHGSKPKHEKHLGHDPGVRTSNRSPNNNRSTIPQLRSYNTPAHTKDFFFPFAVYFYLFALFPQPHFFPVVFP